MPLTIQLPFRAGNDFLKVNDYDQFYLSQFRFLSVPDWRVFLSPKIESKTKFSNRISQFPQPALF